MIQEIRLEHFQRHLDRRFILCPGLNVFVGPTDSGKSSVIRAIKWLALHESQDGIVSHGETSVKVGIKTDQAPIIRFRDRKKYGYRLGSTEYLACGKEQPIDIKQAHNLTEINFQSQHDSHYLLTLTPGQASKEINKIVSLDAIDTAITWLKTKDMRINMEIELSQGRIEQYTAQLRGFDDLENRLAILRAVEAITINNELLYSKSTEISDIVIEVEELNRDVFHLDCDTKLVEAYLEAVKRLEATKASKQALASILGDHKASESLPRLDALVAAVEAQVGLKQRHAALRDMLWEYAALAALIETIYSEIKQSLASSVCIVTATGSRVTALKESVTDLKELRKQFTTIGEEIGGVETAIQKLGNVCPHCGKLLPS
jgi:exonuclease SbcC